MEIQVHFSTKHLLTMLHKAALPMPAYGVYGKYSGAWPQGNVTRLYVPD